MKIPEGNLVLLCDHPEDCNKIQDRYKSEEFVVVGRWSELNVYCIMPVSGNGPVWTDNWCQLQDLGKSQKAWGLSNPQSSHDRSQVCSFNHKTKLTKSPPEICITMSLFSKGRFPMLSLSTTTGVAGSGLRPVQAQRVTCCSRYTGKSL